MKPGQGITVCHKQPDGSNDFCLHLWNQGFQLPTGRTQVIGEGSGLYAGFLADAATVNQIFSTLENIADETTRRALLGGIESAVKALHEKASPYGLHVTLHS